MDDEETLEVDAERSAVLLEQCMPGTSLRSLPEEEQDQVVAGGLKRQWPEPSSSYAFRPMSEMISYWNSEALHKLDASMFSDGDAELAREAVSLLGQLSADTVEKVLLATDLHAGNVLRAERLPWLAIDPKPFVGDPACDATQHLLNCRERLQAEPGRTIRQFADLLNVDHVRVRLWLFARLASELEPASQALARRVENV